MSTTKNVEHTAKGAAAETKKEVHKEQAKDPHQTAGTRAKAAAKVPGEKMEAEGHKNHPATTKTSKHPTSSTDLPTAERTSIKTTTKDGIKISVEGAGPKVPSIDGRAPSNKQIDSVISGAHKGLESEKPHLDAHGKEIVSSTQNVLDATSLLLNEKNKEERFQKLFRFTQGTAKGGPSEGATQAARSLMQQATGMGSKISNNSTDVISYIRETIFNLTTSGEFRQLAIEFLNLLQSLMGQLQTAVATADENKPLKARKLKSQVFDNDEDRLEDINEKLAAFLKRVGKNPQYKAVINNFMKYSEEIYDELYRAKSNTSGTKEATALRTTLDEGWEILNDFVGDNKLVPKFKKNLQVMLQQLRKDQELSRWMHDVKQLLFDLMEHPENVPKDQKRTSALIRQGGDLTDKYRFDLDRLYSQAGKIVERIQSDPVINNFQLQLEQLGRDIALNSKGQPDLFVLQKSLNVIRDLLVERFRKVLVDVPIERVQIQSDSMNMVLKNITVQGKGLVPTNLHVEMASLSDFNFERSTDAVQKFRMRLRVDQICPHFKGVKFNFKKTSFPSVSDKGIADIIFEGKGLSVDVSVQFIIASDRITKAVLETCNVDIEKVSLKIEEAKHERLGTMFAPIIQSRLKAKMQTGVYQFVHGRVGQIINQLNTWFKTKPFESMMVKGNETMQTAMEKSEQKNLAKKEKSNRKLEADEKKAGKAGKEGKKVLTAEEKLKKKEGKIKQRDGTYMLDHQASIGGQVLPQNPYQGISQPGYQPGYGQQPLGHQQNLHGAHQQPMMNQQGLGHQQHPGLHDQHAGHPQHPGQNAGLHDQHHQGLGHQQHPGSHDQHGVGHNQHSAGLHDQHGLGHQQHPGSHDQHGVGHNQHSTGLHDQHHSGQNLHNQPQHQQGLVHNTGLHDQHQQGLGHQQHPGSHDQHQQGLVHNAGLHDQHHQGLGHQQHPGSHDQHQQHLGQNAGLHNQQHSAGLHDQHGLGHQPQHSGSTGLHNQQHVGVGGVSKSGLQTQEHFVHPPADYHPNQQHGDGSPRGALKHDPHHPSTAVGAGGLTGANPSHQQAKLNQPQHQRQPSTGGWDEFQQPIPAVGAQHQKPGHTQAMPGDHHNQPHSAIGGLHNAGLHDQHQHHNNPNVTKSGLQTQEHFVHPPADYHPNQQHGGAMNMQDPHHNKASNLGHQQSSEVGSADRIAKMLDPNFVSQVKEQPSS